MSYDGAQTTLPDGMTWDTPGLRWIDDELPADGVGVLLPNPAGEWYAVQMRGQLCDHRYVKAILVAVLRTYDLTPLDPMPHVGCITYLTPAEADEIDASLTKHWISARVDRSRLDDSAEGWVWITEAGQHMVLVWENCD